MRSARSFRFIRSTSCPPIGGIGTMSPKTIRSYYSKIYVEEYFLHADPFSTTSTLALVNISHPFWACARAGSHHRTASSIDSLVEQEARDGLHSSFIKTSSFGQSMFRLCIDSGTASAQICLDSPYLLSVHSLSSHSFHHAFENHFHCLIGCRFRFSCG